MPLPKETSVSLTTKNVGYSENLEISRRKLLALGLCSGATFMSITSFAKVPDKFDLETDILIVGTGGAGLSAAVSARQSGFERILVIDKAEVIGGNTLISSGLFNAVDPQRQKPLGIEDSYELFESQILKEGDNLNDAPLVKAFSHKATETLHWLESLGMQFKPEVEEGYGTLFPRCHIPIEPHGSGYIKVLSDYLIKNNVPIKRNCRLTQIYREPENGKVIGCEVIDQGIKRPIKVNRALFLGAGGFAQNDTMCALCDPRLKGLPSTNRPEANGDALQAAISAGASFKNLEFIECIPGKLPGRSERTVLHLFVGQMIWINREGKRFVAEDSRRDVLRESLLSLPERSCFALVDKKGFDFLDKEHQEAINRGLARNEVYKANSLEELARSMNTPAQATVETVERYNQFVENGKDTDFGKKSLLHKISVPPFYACAQAMNRHYCAGGIRINSKTEVLDFSGAPIPKLYAGGEITTGLHGSNRLGGNAIAEAMVFGREFGLTLKEKQA